MQLLNALQTKFEAYQNTGDSATCTARDTCNYGDSLAQMTVTQTRDHADRDKFVHANDLVTG